MKIKHELLEDIIEALIEDIGEGLVATDIWGARDLESLAYIRGNESPASVIRMFNEVTRYINEALKGLDFPGIGNYYLFGLSNGNLALVLLIDTFHQLIIVDLSKTTMGILMNVAIPNSIDRWTAAVK